MNLSDLLKESAYKLTQFKPAQIAALEAGISLKTTDKATTPYVNCLVRGKGDHALNDRIRPADRHHSRAGWNPVTGKQCAVVIARRIGVRAQFGETLFSDSSAAGRIGIRPQFSYRSAKTVGGLVDRHSQVFPGILKNNSLLRMLNKGYGAISALNRVENRLATVGPC